MNICFRLKLIKKKKRNEKKFLACLLPIIVCIAGCGNHADSSSTSSSSTTSEGTTSSTTSTTRTSSVIKEKADKIIYGNIVTIDGDNAVEAVAIKDGKILALGSKDEINNYKSNSMLLMNMQIPIISILVLLTHIRKSVNACYRETFATIFQYSSYIINLI